MISDNDRERLESLIDLETFDTVYECGWVSAECCDLITSLGYYGKPISQKAIDDLDKGTRWGDPKFGLAINACDGASIDEFDTLEDLAKAAKGWVGSVPTSKNSAVCEGTHISLIGATWADVGLKTNDFLSV